MKMRLVLLSEVASIGAGQSAPKDNEFNRSEGLPFIRAGHLENLILYNNINDLPKVNNSGALENRLRVVKKGSILFAKSGMSAMMNRVYLVTQDSYFVSHLASVTPNKSFLDSRFCYFFLKFFGTSKLIKDSAYPSIGLPDIQKIKIPLPPLETQKRIADILDAADALRQKDQELLKKYDELAQAIFFDMFGDPESNFKGFEKVKFLDLFNIETGKLDSNHSVINGKYPFFTCAKEELAINSFSYDKEALLLAGNNASGVYDVKHYSGKFDAYQRTYILTIDPTLRSYLFYKLHLELKLKDLQKLSIGSSTKYLTMKIFERIEFLSPPLDLQNRFAERVALIKEQKTIAGKSLEKSEEMFNSLLQKAFKGEMI